ncbi:hypothetical protein BOTBODRAFT_110963 [Botryobasidium botryosum FD-172 SS1]|uniref:Cytochrome b-c1 complex subunit 8 n=1 Tax=Botryobasidium botryosum (strain FD-172 SS1) TaxID=930990 RepID=A0A067MPK2_BOTB1|nr:hypothetical protein BOTBODRAFT_110963 [Botryobasidium botryosum FD-172 SS1]
MGWWGSMGGPKQKGITQYGLSHFRQRPFAGALHGYIFNGYARIVSQAPYFVLPLGFAYGVYTWANQKAAWLQTKEGHAHGGEH